MKRLISLLFVLACQKPSTVADAGVAASASSSPAVASAGPATPDGGDVAKTLTPREVALAWNAAHATHDLAALAALYSVRVDFYGQTVTNAQCVASKKKAFEKSPDYTQAIRDVVVADDGTVTFTKTSTIGGKSTDYPAVLVVRQGLVVSETDKVTEANLAAHAAHDGDWCLDATSWPTEKIVPPYRISAMHAYQKARLTKHFKEMERRAHGEFLDFAKLSCPTKCDRTQRECGYDMRLENHSARVMNDPQPHSNMIEWVYVDAVDATLWFEADGWQSEPLPP